MKIDTAHYSNNPKNCPAKDYYLNDPKLPKLSERNESFMEFYNKSLDCVVHRNCDVRHEYFDKKLKDILHSIRGTALVKKYNYRPSCYIESNEINFNKLIHDEIYFMDYKAVKETRLVVCILSGKIAIIQCKLPNALLICSEPFCGFRRCCVK